MLLFQAQSLAVAGTGKGEALTADMVEAHFPCMELRRRCWYGVVDML
jgi:hypothetical protein